MVNYPKNYRRSSTRFWEIREADDQMECMDILIMGWWIVGAVKASLHNTLCTP